MSESTEELEHDIFGVEDDKSEEDSEETDQEEARKRVVAGPASPSRSEYENHVVTHWPYRSWCAHCVRGRAVASQHRKLPKDGESLIPLISLDYTHMGTNDEETIPCLVARDSRSGATIATTVKQKGASDEWAVEYMKKLLFFPGYKRVVLKSDQEPSILEVKAEVARQYPGEVAPEESPVKDHESNGRIENAIKEVQGLTRTLKDQLEGNAQVKLSMDNAIMLWMLIHAGNILTCFKVQRDGRTAFQRLRGRKATSYMAQFGEKVLFQKVTHSSRANKMDSRWDYGLYLGFSTRSMESNIWTPDGMEKARNIRRLTEDKRWDADMILRVSSAPWSRRKPQESFEMPKEDDKQQRTEAPKAEAPKTKVLRMKIRKGEVIKYGPTPGCAGCKAAVHGRYTANHTDACRKRLEERIATTPEGAERRDRRRQAQDEYLADEIEREIKRARQQEKEQLDDTKERDDEENHDKAFAPSSSREANRDSSSGKQPRVEQEDQAESLPKRMRNADHWEDKDGTEEGKRWRPDEREDNNECQLFQLPRLAAKVKDVMDSNSIDFLSKRNDGKIWNFAREDHRHEAKQILKNSRPKLIIGGIPPAPKIDETTAMLELGKHVEHAEFICGLYRDQLRARRHVIHAHEEDGSSWKLPCLTEVMSHDNMRHVKMVRNGNKIMKYAASEKEILKWIPREGCRSSTVSEALEAGMLAAAHAREKDYCQYGKCKFYDNITGAELDRDRVMEARRVETDFFKKMGVFERITRDSAVRDNIPIIPVRWVDVDKGTIYRSRLVAKEFKKCEKPELFAATPPLECMKMLIAKLAMASGKYRMLHVDVSRAYMHAKATRKICIEIPTEMRKKSDDIKDTVGLLKVALYGTRDGAANWEAEYVQFLESVSYQRGRASPCLFKHDKSDTSGLVHGDDFIFVGEEAELDRLMKRLQGRYPVKCKMLGPRAEDHNEIVALNRTIAWTDKGIVYKPDPKHAAAIITELGVENCRSFHTTGSRDKMAEQREHDLLLASQDVTRYRSCVARCNYLGQDRPELQYAVKEVAKGMANPKESDWMRLKRLAKYIRSYPHSHTTYRWGGNGAQLTGYTDSDWAGDSTTRKSTSGGCITWSGSIIKSWSRTQKTVALSSGEAEFYAAVRTAQELLGIVALGKDLGIEMDAIMKTDAKATVGMISRRGIGGMRHLDVQHLWLQDVVKEKRIGVGRVCSRENVADILTKYVDPECIQRHLNHLGIIRAPN